MTQDYFIDATLIRSNLILLTKFIIEPIPNELKQNNNIRIKIRIDNDGKTYTFENCHIDNTKKRRLHIPNAIITWIRSNFPFSTDSLSDGSKCYIIDKTTPWLDVSQYSKTSFNHPGIYLLRRKLDDGDFAYYIGKSTDIQNRIVKNDDKISHPDEKCEENKQYDSIACVSINFNDIAKLYGSTDITPLNNPGVKRGSNIDSALYAIEDVAIHTVAMILLSEGKKLDNKQYRQCTSEWF